MNRINFVYRNYSVNIEKMSKCRFYSFEITNNIQMIDEELKSVKGIFHPDKEIRMDTGVIDKRFAEIYYILCEISRVIKFNEQEVKHG